MFILVQTGIYNEARKPITYQFVVPTENQSDLTNQTDDDLVSQNSNGLYFTSGAENLIQIGDKLVNIANLDENSASILQNALLQLTGSVESSNLNGSAVVSSNLIGSVESSNLIGPAVVSSNLIGSVESGNLIGSENVTDQGIADLNLNINSNSASGLAEIFNSDRDM